MFALQAQELRRQLDEKEEEIAILQDTVAREVRIKERKDTSRARENQILLLARSLIHTHTRTRTHLLVSLTVHGAGAAGQEPGVCA